MRIPRAVSASHLAKFLSLGGRKPTSSRVPLMPSRFHIMALTGSKPRISMAKLGYCTFPGVAGGTRSNPAASCRPCPGTSTTTMYAPKRAGTGGWMREVDEALGRQVEAEGRDGEQFFLDRHGTELVGLGLVAIQLGLGVGMDGRGREIDQLQAQRKGSPG